MKLMPGAADVARLLDSLGIPRGLITRNVLSSVSHFHSTTFQERPFAPALARCFKPYKPAPDGLLHICKSWGIDPQRVVMVGDSPKDDIVCGNRAGAVTVLFDSEHQHLLEDLPTEQQPTFHVSSMHEMMDMLLNRCQLVGKCEVV
jgi:phosphoglycolate phosphatase-like HAD superfamily hydrolase